MSIVNIPEANKCPCCGCEAELIIKYVSYGYEYSIECSSCLFSVGWHQSKEAALAVWNNIENEKYDEEGTSEVEVLKAQIDLLKRELDAAIKDIPRVCGYCRHFTMSGDMPSCTNEKCHHISGVNTGWEWRGVPQEAEHEQS